MVIFQANRRVLPGRLRTEESPVSSHVQIWDFPMSRLTHNFHQENLQYGQEGHKEKWKQKDLSHILTPIVRHRDPEVQCCWQPGIKGFVVVVLEKRYLNTKYNLNDAIVQCWKKHAYTLCLVLQIQLRAPQCIAAFVLRKIKKSKEKHLTRTALCSSWFYLFF